VTEPPSDIDALEPYLAAIDHALDAAAAHGLDLDPLALLLIERAFPTYEEDASVMIARGVDALVSALDLPPTEALGVIVHPLPEDAGDAIWVAREIVAAYLEKTENHEALAQLATRTDATTTTRVPLLLLGRECGMFYLPVDQIEIPTGVGT